MKVKHKETGVLAQANAYNMHGLGEMIVMFEKEGMDSDFCRDYLFLLSNGEWVEHSDRRIVHDNFNRYFREAQNQEEMKKGYYD